MEVFNIDTTGFRNASIQWSTGETTPSVTVTGGTISTLSVIVDNGCISGDTIAINNFDSISHCDDRGCLYEKDIREDQLLGYAFIRIPVLGYVKIWFVELINLVIAR